MITIEGPFDFYADGIRSTTSYIKAVVPDNYMTEMVILYTDKEDHKYTCSNFQLFGGGFSFDYFGYKYEFVIIGSYLYSPGDIIDYSSCTAPK